MLACQKMPSALQTGDSAVIIPHSESATINFVWPSGNMAPGKVASFLVEQKIDGRHTADLGPDQVSVTSSPESVVKINWNNGWLAQILSVGQAKISAVTPDGLTATALVLADTAAVKFVVIRDSVFIRITRTDTVRQIITVYDTTVVIIQPPTATHTDSLSVEIWGNHFVSGTQLRRELSNGIQLPERRVGKVGVWIIAEYSGQSQPKAENFLLGLAAGGDTLRTRMVWDTDTEPIDTPVWVFVDSLAIPDKKFDVVALHAWTTPGYINSQTKGEDSVWLARGAKWQGRIKFVYTIKS